MKGVIKSIDRMVQDLDQVLSNRRLKPSERRKLKKMREELGNVRLMVANNSRRNSGLWFLHFMSLLSKAAEMLDRHFS